MLGSREGVLIDATHSPDFVRTMADLLARRRTLPGRHGQIVGLPSPGLRRFNGCLREDCPATPLSGEQSNTSVLLGDQAIMKFIRRFEEGINPGVEISRFLSERARFAHAPRAGGSIEYRGDALGAAPATVSVLEEYVPNEGDGWQYVVDALTLGLEDALTNAPSSDLEATSAREALHPGPDGGSRPPARRSTSGVGFAARSADGGDCTSPWPASNATPPSYPSRSPASIVRPSSTEREA